MRISDWSSDVCSSDLLGSDDAGKGGKGQHQQQVKRGLTQPLGPANHDQRDLGKNPTEHIAPSPSPRRALSATSCGNPSQNLHRTTDTEPVKQDRKSTRLNSSH